LAKIIQSHGARSNLTELQTNQTNSYGSMIYGLMDLPALFPAK